MDFKWPRNVFLGVVHEFEESPRCQNLVILVAIQYIQTFMQL